MKIAHMLSANIFHAPRFRASNERIEKCALTKEGVLVSSPHTNTREKSTKTCDRTQPVAQPGALAQQQKVFFNVAHEVAHT